MRIVSSSGLSDEEIESMIRDASAYRAEDSRRREAAEARNQLDGLVYNTARSYEEFGDPLSREDAEEIEQLLAAAEDAMESGDLEVIQEAHDALFVAAQRLADIIYSGISDVFDDELFDDDDVNDDLSDPEGVQNLGIENTALESDP
jgi:molecular chaperone DnaK